MFTNIYNFYHIFQGSDSGCLGVKTISTPFLIRSLRSSRRGKRGSSIFSFSLSGFGVGCWLQLLLLLQLHGAHGCHGWQTGHEQQGLGGGGGHGWHPVLQHDVGHLGGHIHQIVQGEQLQPLQQHLNFNNKS